MARTALVVAEQIISNTCAEVQSGEKQEMLSKKGTEKFDMHQDAEDPEVSKDEFDIVRSRVFNVHSIQSIIIAKLKAETSQGTELCKYKRDIGSDGSLMYMSLFKALHPNIKIWI